MTGPSSSFSGTKPVRVLLPALGDLEHAPLGLVDDLARLAAFRVVGARGDLAADVIR